MEKLLKNLRIERIKNAQLFAFVSLKGKTVLLRTDYDVPLETSGSGGGFPRSKIKDDSRITESLPTINYLVGQGAKVIIISHLGRPEGRIIPELSSRPVGDYLAQVLKTKTKREGKNIGIFPSFWVSENIWLLENIRFWPGEEKNDPEFVSQLASLGDFYVNDAFAVSHRRHASIVGLPERLPSAFGYDFLEEMESLSSLRQNPKRPVAVILGGTKEDKLAYIQGLLGFVDWILLGGRLPILWERSKLKTKNSKLVVANLAESGKDIDQESVEKFKRIIMKAGTIVWAGPMGKYEETQGERGTKLIAEAVIASRAYKVLGGGDTEAALTRFGLVGKIDYVSSGGGAMLEYLAKGTLPGIEAVIKGGKNSGFVEGKNRQRSGWEINKRGSLGNLDKREENSGF